MKFALETKVGIFVVGATLLIVAMGIVFGKVDFSRDKGYSVDFEIIDASGIKPNSPVYYRGVKIGFVESINLEGDTLLADLRIMSQYKIPDNVIFTIRQAGFVGQKYVELVRDSRKPAASVLESGNRYYGNQSVTNMDDVLKKVDQMASQITALVSSLNDVFSRDESREDLKETIGHLKAITANIDRLLASNDKKFDEIIENARHLTEVVDRLVAKNELSINKSLANIEELTASLKNFTASVDNVTETNRENIDKSLSNIKELTEKFNSAMDDVGNIAKDINEGKGTLGMLINDNETKEDVKSVVQNIRSMVSRVRDYKLYVTFGADYLFDANDARGYVNLRLYTSPRTFYQLGVSNTPRLNPVTTKTRYQLIPAPGSTLPGGIVAFESEKEQTKSSTLAFSLQYGHIFYDIIGMRVGIFDNTLGLAADIYPLKNDNLTISAEAYDFGSFNNGLEIYTRAYIKWHFFKQFFVQAGVEDILNNTHRVYTVGAGVRFADDDLKYFAGTAATAAAVR